MEFEASTRFIAVFGIIVLVRLLLPFTIFRYPLPGIVGCLVADAIDQTVLQWFGYDPPFYQGYDKAMDVYYLAIAFIATMRNWTNLDAYGVSRFLFFFRQVGVVAFELSQLRVLLLVFPNTFEYFFIAYEAIRSKWDPRRTSRRTWIAIAAVIWVGVKLPQEYWIHVAKLDFTEAVRDIEWFAPFVTVVGVVVLLAGVWLTRRYLTTARHEWQLAAPPLPEAIATGAQRMEFIARHDRVWSIASLEKTALIGLLSVIFVSIIPSREFPALQLVTWIGVVVVLNAALSISRARQGKLAESALASFGLRLGFNAALLVATSSFFVDALTVEDALFFALLFSILVTAYDRSRPILDWRRMNAEEAAS